MEAVESVRAFYFVGKLQLMVTQGGASTYQYWNVKTHPKYGIIVFVLAHTISMARTTVSVGTERDFQSSHTIEGALKITTVQSENSNEEERDSSPFINESNHLET